MSDEQYALIGLGRPRSAWLTNLSLWATSGAIPVDFSKCLSYSELHNRLSDLRPYSAVMVESGSSGLDRDLVALAARSGSPVIVIDANDDSAEGWLALGVAAVLHPLFSPSDLLHALHAHARSVGGRADATALSASDDDSTSPSGRLIAICGPGGTGTSTVSIAIAQGLADDVRLTSLVMLADFARNGEQSMIHDSGDVVPGVEELVDANRHRRSSIEEVHQLTYAVPSRGYDLLLGRRRAGAWTAMPPRAVETSISSLLRAYRAVVADVTADFEDESDGGSVDIEERNALARHAVATADAVLVVGAPGMKGVHSLVHIARELIAKGVPPTKLLLVVNRAPRSPITRLEITRTAAKLLADQPSPIAAPIFVPECRIEHALRDGSRLPNAFVSPLTSASRAIVERNAGSPTNPSATTPRLITPGTLGLFDRAVGE